MAKNLEILEKLKKNSNSRLKVGGVQDDIEFVSTGMIGLDHRLGGGIPRGRVVEIYGPTGSGKTSLSMSIANSFEKSGDRVLFVDTEGTYPRHLVNIFGIKNIDLYDPNSGEDAVDFIVKSIDEGYGLIILDSVGMVTPMSMQNDVIESSNIGNLGKLMTKFMRLVTDKLRETGGTLLLINHEKDKIGSMYGGKYTAGGASIPYTASLRLRISDTGKAGVKEDKEGRKVYKTCKVTIVKTKMKAVHNNEIDLYLDLKGRFSSDVDLIMFGISVGVIKQNGSYFKYMDTNLGQGVLGIKDNLRTDKVMYAKMVGDIQMRAKIIDKSDDLVFGDDIVGYNKMVTEYNKKYGYMLEIYDKK